MNGTAVLALAIVAAIVAAVDLVRYRGQSLTTWAVLVLAVAVVGEHAF